MAIALPYDGWEPRPYQEPAWDFLFDGGKRASLIWNRRAGKDEVILHHIAVSAHRRVGNYWHLLPTHVQARKAMWNGVNAKTGRRRVFDAFGPPPQHPDSLIHRMLDDEMIIEFKNGSTYQVFGSDNYDSAVGSGPVGIAFSEWALAKPEAWVYFEPMIRENDGWAVMITTPRGHNHAYDFHKMAMESDEWFAQTLTVRETKVVSEEELNNALIAYQSALGPAIGFAKWEQEWFCSWEAVSTESFILADTVQKAMERRVPFDLVKGRERIIGVDVARHGADRSVIAMREGPFLHPLKILQNVNNVELAQHVMHAISQFQPDKVNIDAGRGEGVIDYCRASGFSVTEVNFGGSSGDPHYSNKKAEMWGRMREWLEEAGQIPQDPELRADLIGPQFTFNNKDQLVLESKKEMKRRLQREGRGDVKSSDCADATALTFAAPRIAGNEARARRRGGIRVNRGHAANKARYWGSAYR